MCIRIIVAAASVLYVLGVNGDQPTALRFLKQPSDVNIDQYGRVRLRCRFFGLEPNYIIRWFKNDQVFSQGLKLIGEHPAIDYQRYSVVGGFKKAYFDLKIWDVNSLDAGNYSCNVYGAPSTNDAILGDLLLRSRTSKVTVYYLPPVAFPECSVDAQRELQIGETVTVCHSPKGYPAISLELENPLDPSRVTVETTSDHITIKLTVSELEIGQSYWCKATSKYFRFYLNRCQVGPLNIVFKPRVVIRPLRFVIQETEDAEYVCESESSPEPSKILWSVYPAIEDDRIKINDADQSLLIKKIKNSDDGRLISCTAINTQGNDTAYRVIAVRQPNFKRPQPNTIEVRSVGTGMTTHNERVVQIDVLPHCSEFTDRVLLPMLVGIIVLLLVAIVALLVRSRTWIFPKQFLEHSAQTEIMRPLTDYEFQPAFLPIENKEEHILNVT